jgi:uncharacterized protein (TIGR03083 family)
MMTTATDARSIARIGHDEAMQITEVEFARMLSAARALGPDDWSCPTVNTGWDVRDVMLHLLGAAEANASFRENAHQMRHGKRLFKQIGGHHWVDGVNEIQIRERATLTNAEILDRYEAAGPRAVKARRRIPAPVRALPLVEFPEPLGRKTLGYLMDMVYTRDVWMHRVDIARATGQPLELTAEHDGRIVADIVAEWATLHDHTFDLQLEGPAGGAYRAGVPAVGAGGGAAGEQLTIDAVELICVLSGRGPTDASPLLGYPLPM